MESTLFAQGIDMMLYGMGSVFIFLLALVLTINLMSWVISTFFPVAQPVTDTGDRSVPTVEPITKKIIQAAIDQHRQR